MMSLQMFHKVRRVKGGERAPPPLGIFALQALLIAVPPWGVSIAKYFYAADTVGKNKLCEGCLVIRIGNL